MKKYAIANWLFPALMLLALAALPAGLRAQIYEPEGLNMPGAWNEWTNPPVNNLALASSTQVPDGRVIKISTGIPRWQTSFSVAASGADLVGGTYDFLFTSGPSDNAFANKWSGVTITMNTLQDYLYQDPADNNITLTDGNWYTMNWEDQAYGNTRAIFMETGAEPVEIMTVSVPGTVAAGEAVSITLTTDAAPSAEEILYLRYSTDGWNSSALLEAVMSGSTGTAEIPGQSEGTTVSYYAFSSTVAGITSDYDLYTIKLNNNAGVNYSYTVEGTPQPEISWANLQWPPNGEIAPAGDFTVYAQVYADGITSGDGQGANITAWIGYSTTDTDPSGWTNWVAATYNGDDGDNDEYLANIGTGITTEGTYYYVSRFQLSDGDFVYGGYSDAGGGFWDGTTNVSGVLTVTDDITPDEITWANLQWPADGEIELGNEFISYAQLYVEGVTGTGTASDRIQAWIGFSTEDTDPASWTSWIGADFNGNVTDNDEYLANIGPQILETGTFYYASRFKLDDQDYVYGGFSPSGGGFWDGTTNVSGVLTVTEDQPDPDFDWVNLQYPGSGTIEPGADYDVYAQAYIEGLTGSGTVNPEISAWIGYSTSNTNPDSWTNWIAAPFASAQGDNDEFMANLGAEFPGEGTYYYASRFQLGEGEYYYGGYSATGGGFWDGTTNVSGVVIVQETPPDPEIDWANLQYPGSGLIEPGDSYDVFARVWIDGLTGGDEPLDGLEAWIGYSTDNSNPNSWDTWLPASFNGAIAGNDEYMAEIGTAITEEGTYYYASRFRYNEGTYVYGGYSVNGGGFWDGVNNISGTLIVETEIPDPEISWANLQWPGSGEIYINEVFNVYGRVFIEELTGNGSPADGLDAWVGFSIENTDPAGWTNWVTAGFNGSIGDNDEFRANIGALINQTGTYYYATRFKLGDGSYVYGGFSQSGGGFWDGTTNLSGVLTVTESPSAWPVNFTLIDATELHDNIHFKGEMTDWQPVPMIPDGHTWTLSLLVEPGSYEWGAIEDDGSPDGIWLIEGSNLVVNISEDGVITGDTLYTTLITSVSAMQEQALKLYPNPAQDQLRINGLSQAAEYRISDLSGRMIQSGTLAPDESIPLSALSAGVFVLEIRQAGSIQQLKFIKR